MSLHPYLYLHLHLQPVTHPAPTLFSLTFVPGLSVVPVQLRTPQEVKEVKEEREKKRKEGNSPPRLLLAKLNTTDRDPDPDSDLGRLVAFARSNSRSAILGRPRSLVPSQYVLALGIIPGLSLDNNIQKAFYHLPSSLCQQSISTSLTHPSSHTREFHLQQIDRAIQLIESAFLCCRLDCQ